MFQDYHKTIILLASCTRSHDIVGVIFVYVSPAVLAVPSVVLFIGGDGGRMLVYLNLFMSTDREISGLWWSDVNVFEFLEFMIIPSGLIIILHSYYSRRKM